VGGKAKREKLSPPEHIAGWLQPQKEGRRKTSAQPRIGEKDEKTDGWNVASRHGDGKRKRRQRVPTETYLDAAARETAEETNYAIVLDPVTMQSGNKFVQGGGGSWTGFQLPLPFRAYAIAINQESVNRNDGYQKDQREIDNEEFLRQLAAVMRLAKPGEGKREHNAVAAIEWEHLLKAAKDCNTRNRENYPSFWYRYGDNNMLFPPTLPLV